MGTVPTTSVATIVLFVFYWVSFTKFLFNGIGQPTKQPDGTRSQGNPSLSNGIIRLWALLAGIAGALVSYFMTTASYNRVGIYDQILLGASGAVGAIVTYHISNLFTGAFDSLDGTTTTVTVQQPPTPPTMPPAQVSVSQTSQPVAQPSVVEIEPTLPQVTTLTLPGVTGGGPAVPIILTTPPPAAPSGV